MDGVRWGHAEAAARRDPAPHVRLRVAGLDPALGDGPRWLPRSVPGGVLRLSAEEARRLRDELTAAIAVLEEERDDR